MSNNIVYSTPLNIGQPGSVVRANGGGGHQVIGYRGVLDARRSVGDPSNRVPSAAYPDGYLGTIQGRRDDKLLKSVQSRLTQRSYQRGVHKGERIDPQDYQWTADVNPMAGLDNEATGQRWAPKGSPTERLAHMGKVNTLTPDEILALAQKTGIDPNNQTQVVNAQRKMAMHGLLPSWK
jgi:hypothetical protein